MVYTAADPGSACPQAESPKLQSLFFLIFHQLKRVLSSRSSKSPEIYPIKTCFVFKRVRICNFRLRRARPGIRRPWTCSCSHTYIQYSNPQIHLLWPQGNIRLSHIEVLFLKVTVFQSIILLLQRTDIKVLKDALACQGPYQTLMEVRGTDPGG